MTLATQLPPTPPGRRRRQRFTTKSPGQVLTILPDDFYAKRKTQSAPKGVIPGHDVAASFEEAVEPCKAKVSKIAAECRRINQKYRDGERPESGVPDPSTSCSLATLVHYDIEWDRIMQWNYCIEGLVGDSTIQPASVKRVEVSYQLRHRPPLNQGGRMAIAGSWQRSVRSRTWPIASSYRGYAWQETRVSFRHCHKYRRC